MDKLKVGKEVGEQGTETCTGCAEQFTIMEAFVSLAILTKGCTDNEQLERMAGPTQNRPCENHRITES